MFCRQGGSSSRRSRLSISSLYFAPLDGVYTEFGTDSFTGGNLSSDAGILLLKEFYHKLGVDSLAKETFLTTDPGHYRIHKDHENLLQMLYQITAAYFQDDHANALRHDPVLTAVVEKPSLAFQPTLSRLPSASGSCYRVRSGLSPPSYRPCRAHSKKFPKPYGFGNSSGGDTRI